MAETISEEYIKQLQQLHNEKATFGDAKGLKSIERWIDDFDPQSIIDYGCGKGGIVLALKEQYPAINTVGYDPGMPEFNTKPKKQFDMLISTDVLEHIEPVFLDSVLKEINDYFTKCAFLIIATSPAKKSLPDGRNAHLIVEPPEWWKNKIETLMPDCAIHWHEFVEKTRTDKAGNTHPNNKYIVVLRRK